MTVGIHAREQRGAEVASSEPVHRILVVEDDRAFGEVLEVTLRGRGYAIVRATTVKEARAALASSGPVELIVTDQRLPDELGYHLMFAEEVLRDHTPVLVMTASPSEALRSFLRRRGVPLIEKPFTLKRLVADVLAITHSRPVAA